MPSQNRVITITGSEPTVLDTELNTLQSSVVMAWEADQEEGSLPTSFLGGKTLMGEYTLGAGVEGLELDMVQNYWRCVPYNYRNRMCNITLCTVTAADRLPSGSAHRPANILNTYTARFNTKSGQAIGAFTTTAWNPVGDLHLYADSTNGHFYADSGGAGYFFYFFATFSAPTNAAIIGDHRPKSMADCACVTPKFIRTYEDQAVFLQEANQEEQGFPATFIGGTRLMGEWTIGDGINKVLDSSRDWRDAMVIVCFDDVAAAAELPSGASHTTDDSQNPARMLWCLQGGYALGGAWPPAGGEPVWQPIAATNVWIFANSANGNLICRNTTGAAVYVYLDMLLSPATN